MSFDPLTAAMELGMSAIKRIWPDPIDQQREVNRLREIEQSGNLKELELEVSLMVAQISVNLQQAKSKSFFVAGARPAAIWAGVLAMFWQGVIHPVLSWVWAFYEVAGDVPPAMEAAELVAMTGALLGVAGMRSFDKSKKGSTDSLM